MLVYGRLLSSWLCNRVIVRVHKMNAEQRQTAADLWTKPRSLIQYKGPITITIAILLRFDYRFNCAITNVAKLKDWEHALPSTNRNTVNRTTGCHSYLLVNRQNFLCSKIGRQQCRERIIHFFFSAFVWTARLCHLIGYDASRLRKKWTCSFSVVVESQSNRNFDHFVVVESKPNRSRIAIVIGPLIIIIIIIIIMNKQRFVSLSHQGRFKGTLK